MKTKMKSKRGKAIIGIAMAAIMLASVFAAMVPTTSAQDEGTVAEIRYSELAGKTIFIGEIINITGVDYTSMDHIHFVEDTTETAHTFDVPITDNGVVDSNDYAKKEVTRAYVPDGKEGEYYAELYADNTAWTISDISIQVPTLGLKTKDDKGKEVTSTTEGMDITVVVDTNMPGKFDVKLMRKSPKGYEYTLPMDLSDLESYPLSTNDWDTGEHEIWIKTITEKCWDISPTEAPCEHKTVTIYKDEITIEAENEEPVVAEEVLITIRAPPNKEFDFETSHPDTVVMIEGAQSDPTASEPEVYDETTGEGRFKTNKDGVYKFVVKFTEDGTYKFEVEYYDGEKDDIELDVEKADVVFDMPTTVLIGEDLTIKGTITEGESVTIYIDDKTWGKFKDARVTDGVFEEDWDTKGEKTGSYRIDVYIDLKDKMTPPDDKDDIEGIDEDGTTTVRLIEPGLSAEQPRDVIAEEDDYVVEGTATGVSQVDIVIIGPDGYDGNDVTFDFEDGLLFETESVDSDNLFEAEIDTGDADSGKYLVLVLTPGRDGGYGITDYEDGELKKLLTEVYNFDGKSKAQILSMITSVTSEETATDDIMEVLEFTIESPYVELDAIEDVGLGEPLSISGTTNREDETVIMISLTGPVETSATGEVTDNKFNVTIDTTDLLVGPYTVEADDGDGHIDTATVGIGEAAPTAVPTAVPTTEPTAIPTAIPTAEPTAEPTPTPTEEPGFEAVFAIAGLLAIAYLVLRRRK